MDAECDMLVGGGSAWGMSEMTSSLLKSVHFLSHQSCGWFSKAGSLMFLICPGWVGLGTTGAVWESNHHPHHPQMPDVTPLLALPGFQHKPDHLRSSSRIVHHCIATDPGLPRPHWDIWSYSGRHLFLKGGAAEGGVVPQNWGP